MLLHTITGKDAARGALAWPGYCGTAWMETGRASSAICKVENVYQREIKSAHRRNERGGGCGGGGRKGPTHHREDYLFNQKF